MKYVLGPVPSRRLGQSLELDTIPLKTCNWNFVYCQLGCTQPLVNERKDYFPLQEILGEVREGLADLEASGQAQAVDRYGIRFWSAVPAYFPNGRYRQTTAPGCRLYHRSDTYQ